MIQQLCPEEYACAEDIGEYIEKHYGKTMTPGEIAYLTMHIDRIRKNSEKKGV